MSTTMISPLMERTTITARRSVAEVLAPLEALAARSANLVINRGEPWTTEHGEHHLPGYVFVGPQGGDEPIRIGIFAGIHGDEPEGMHAAVRFLTLLENNPELANGYCLFVYPVCNPGGYEDNTRHSRSGKDLNREFWQNSDEPEVKRLEAELTRNAFHGIISLHTDDTSHGLYGFVGGATLTKYLIEPALQAAEQILPRNQNEVIDGFPAQNGIIREAYPGILTAPESVHPRPFEIILETPQAAPDSHKEEALVVALQTILVEYRKFIAYAPNL